MAVVALGAALGSSPPLHATATPTAHVTTRHLTHVADLGPTLPEGNVGPVRPVPSTIPPGRNDELRTEPECASGDRVDPHRPSPPTGANVREGGLELRFGAFQSVVADVA